MSLRHAILGFLSYMPMSGYDLKKGFDGSVSHFWPADQSQIYRTLSGLVDDTLVTRETIEQDGRPDRHVYHITDAGQSELRDWLATPLPPSDDREPFLIQVFFAANLERDQALHLLEEQRESIRAEYAIYETMLSEIETQQTGQVDQKALFYTLLTLEQVLAVGQGYLRWLDAAIDRVRREAYTPLHPDNYPPGESK